jgi:hypothetical protein
MNTGQMLALIFAIALFATIVMTVNYSLLSQSELVYRGMYITQGQNISEKYFDKIEAEAIVSNPPIVPFDFIGASYPNTTVSLGSVNYEVYISTQYTDSLGTPMGFPTDFQRVDIKIYCVGLLDTIRFNRLFGKVDL